MRLTGILIIGASALIYGCAATVPSELANARLAYKHVSEGPAARLAPASLHDAQEALAKAERAFIKDAKAYRTLDLAYVAQRRAEMADAHASIAMEQASKASADKEYQVTQGDMLEEKTQDLNETRTALAASERSAQATAEQLGTEQQARLEAERKTSEARAALAKLAAIKEDERGMVITLSGSVIFRSNEATLMPGAEARLDQVVDALATMGERNVTVEGHTDSQGSDEHNRDLSQRRADAVRDYLVLHGYPSGRVQAYGAGEVRPIADNATSEGRANNRRVEIILQREAKAGVSGVWQPRNAAETE